MNPQNHHAYERWNEVVHAVCGRFTTRRPDYDRPFFGDIQPYDLGGLDIADIRTNADAIRREHGRVARGDDRFYFLVMQRQGAMAVDAGHQRFILHPGDMALLDSAQTFEMCPLGMINQLSVHLHRDVVDQNLPVSASRFGKLARDSFHGQLLQSLLRQLTSLRLDNAAANAPEHGASLQSVLITLLEPLLGDGTGRSDAARDVRSLAQHLIEQALHAPLSPKELASRLKISVRQLYRQFEQSGETIHRYTLRRRLERCADDLTALSRRNIPIARIASQWGFTDPAYFSRAFKRHFGLSPAAYRAQANPS